MKKKNFMHFKALYIGGLKPNLPYYQGMLVFIDATPRELCKGNPVF